MQVNKLRSLRILCYVDDLLCHTKTTEQHLDELRKVFQMHREAGAILKAKKTDLFETQAHYLRYKVLRGEDLREVCEVIQREAHSGLP